MAEKWANAQDIIQRASGGSLLRGTLHKVDIRAKFENPYSFDHLVSTSGQCHTGILTDEKYGSIFVVH